MNKRLACASGPASSSSSLEQTAMSTAATDPWIETFTTPTCPDCIAVKRWFTAQGIPFVERDLRDPQLAEEARRRSGLRIAPITIIEGEVFFGTFREQIGRIEAALGMRIAA
jgi:glutaredoxin